MLKILAHFVCHATNRVRLRSAINFLPKLMPLRPSSEPTESPNFPTENALRGLAWIEEGAIFNLAEQSMSERILTVMVYEKGFG